VRRRSEVKTAFEEFREAVEVGFDAGMGPLRMEEEIQELWSEWRVKNSCKVCGVLNRDHNQWCVGSEQDRELIQE
jgi:hypothetical protein